MVGREVKGQGGGEGSKRTGWRGPEGRKRTGWRGGKAQGRRTSQNWEGWDIMEGKRKREGVGGVVTYFQIMPPLCAFQAYFLVF